MKKFWIQFSLFLVFSLVIPISFIAIRFKLFSTTKQINTITVWAVIAICILFLVVSLMIKVYLDGMKTRYSLLKQILQGFVRVILPVAACLILVIFMKRVLIESKEAMLKGLENMYQVLLVSLVSESIAIVVNPLPKWSFDNNVEGLAEIYDKVKGGDKG